MKKTFLCALLLGGFVAAMAQQPVMTFQKTEHDFGKINEADGRVTTIFEFKNEGLEPLVLSNVRASCGCTTPKWTREPIEPGQTGTITVTYNPTGRPGKFRKTITITSNASEATKKLAIFGEVIPKTAEPVNRYAIKMGDLSLRSNAMAFNTLMKGNNLTRSIEYANLTDHDITVEVLQNDKDLFLTPVLSLKTLKPKESGTLNVNFDTKNCKQWGPVTAYLYLMVNGKKAITDEFKITLNASIEEDFSKMSVEARQQAPIFDIASKEINLGNVKAGATLTKNIAFKNVGENALQIRRVVNNVTGVHVTATKNVIKGGKSGAFKVEVVAKKDANTLLAPGVYRRQIEIFTNDPANQRLRLTLVWTVVE